MPRLYYLGMNAQALLLCRIRGRDFLHKRQHCQINRAHDDADVDVVEKIYSP